MTRAKDRSGSQSESGMIRCAKIESMVNEIPIGFNPSKFAKPILFQSHKDKWKSLRVTRLTNEIINTRFKILIRFLWVILLFLNVGMTKPTLRRWSCILLRVIALNSVFSCRRYRVVGGPSHLCHRGISSFFPRSPPICPHKYEMGRNTKDARPPRVQSKPSGSTEMRASVIGETVR